MKSDVSRINKTLPSCSCVLSIHWKSIEKKEIAGQQLRNCIPTNSGIKRPQIPTNEQRRPHTTKMKGKWKPLATQR